MSTDRFRLTRGGILNVWQYDDQVFDFGGGRLLLRGTNGAGKSKTLEMLLPFVLDGDKGRITASGRHHTSLLWLMLDGYAGQSRTGYLWVELQRTTDAGTETVTCGIGLRASQAARAATTWYFTSPRRVGVDLHLSDASGPLTMSGLRAEVETDGHFFDGNATRRYREHVGQLLFGLPLDQYEDLLRLLYWLRQPQVGEDIDPRRLAEQLVQALPQVDESAIRTAGDTFDQLEDFGEQIDRQERAAVAIGDFLQTYTGYARGVVESRVRATIEAQDHERRCHRDVRRLERDLDQSRGELTAARDAKRVAESQHAEAVGRIAQLEAGPEARAQQRLLELDNHLRTRRQLADTASARLDEQRTRVDREQHRADAAASALAATANAWVRSAREARSASAEAGLSGLLGRGAHLEVGEPAWRESDSSALPRAGLEPVDAELAELRDRVGAARAAVTVVEEARAAAVAARADADRREEVAAAAEAGVVRREQRLDETVTRALEVGEELISALTAWQALPAAVPFALPELSGDGLATIEGRVSAVVSPVRSGMELRRAEASAEQAHAERQVEQLRTERAAVAAERDPSPTGPTWHRDDRDGRDGAPFWKLVDFRHDVDVRSDEEGADGDDISGAAGHALSAAARARLEAALEGCGLLDAWVLPDGSLSGEVADLFATGADVLDDGRRHLGEVLRAEAQPGDAMGTSAQRVLQRITLADTAQPIPHDAAHSGIVVGLDGTWRTGVLTGRTTKTVAQFIGATARAAERARRLEAIDAAITELSGTIAAAAARVTHESAALEALDAWQRIRPGHDPLLAAWAAEAQARDALDEARSEHDTARRAAEAARAAAARAHGHLVALGQAHVLPITAEALRAREALLVEILAQVKDLDTALASLRRELDRWDEQADRVRAEVDRLTDLAEEAHRAGEAAATAAAELDELRAAAGASVRELERRLEQLATARDRAGADREVQDARIVTLVGAVATEEAHLTEARRLLEAATPALGDAREALVGLERAPGVIEAALGVGALGVGVPGVDVLGVDVLGVDVLERAPRRSAPDAGEATTQEGGDGAGAGPAAYGRWTPDDPRALLAALPDGRRADDTAVVAASQSLSAGSAASHEPRIVKIEEAWVALGLGEGGELPLVELEAQLSETVRANKELLSQRERQIFEEQVLGYLGDSLRGVRLKAAELIEAMNSQLDGVTTSQGIRVRLRWRLRDDIPADARRAVELLGQHMDALLPHERTELRESLHRLIDASRAETPEESYAEHLARALDYRRWFAFTVQYHRPETGDWRDLQRKSALSQGEQKVLCYLPLFAAASAHFTSVAGAAPHAPRFVLLDDAFPKIDARTHPLLFGLLVDLDLDFVVTSERLWGTHSTVPELAIYEALRSPGERGIAQYEHRWDGQQLTAVGGA